MKKELEKEREYFNELKKLEIEQIKCILRILLIYNVT